MARPARLRSEPHMLPLIVVSALDASILAAPQYALAANKKCAGAEPRAGGLLKMVNDGTPFAPVFDDQPVVSIGSFAVGKEKVSAKFTFFFPPGVGPESSAAKSA